MFRRPQIPAFAIAFVTIRFFIPFSQSHSRFGIISQSSLKAFPQISLLIHKIFGQSSQEVKHWEIVQARSLVEQFQPGSFSRAVAAEQLPPRNSRRDFQTVLAGILLCRNCVCLRVSFQWTKNVVIFCLSVVCRDFLNLMVTVDAMTSGGLRGT